MLLEPEAASTQIAHNGSDNNYHFNRLFYRDIQNRAFLTSDEAATDDARHDGQRDRRRTAQYYHYEITQYISQ
ncbi:Vago-PB, isoform B [Yersinia ruckeri ATCC 29473]|nr:Vago-PB, isoform B [Yersinia ruckeri ATCC 29473]PHZ20730.1 vago -PB, isoform B [Yersinia ruckeri]